jgi:hypothetical protein
LIQHAGSNATRTLPGETQSSRQRFNFHRDVGPSSLYCNVGQNDFPFHANFAQVWPNRRVIAAQTGQSSDNLDVDNSCSAPSTALNSHVGRNRTQASFPARRNTMTRTEHARLLFTLLDAAESESRLPVRGGALRAGTGRPRSRPVDRRRSRG